MSEAAGNWRTRTFASLSHDNYRTFFFSQAVSLASRHQGSSPAGPRTPRR